MGNKSQHLKDLSHLLDSNNHSQIIDYIKENSNLPGRRGNLELASAFGECISSQLPSKTNELFDLCLEFTKYNDQVAPGNDPMVMVPFCGVIGIGKIGSSEAHHTKCLDLLYSLAIDPRWRIREAIAMAIADILDCQPEKTVLQLKNWMHEVNWLRYRGIAAGFAEPKILQDNLIRRTAFEFHEKILEQVLVQETSKNEEFKVLVKALGYTLSVVIASEPEIGFKFIEKWIDRKSKLMDSIIKSNLKKNRLIKANTEKVNFLLQKLES